MAKARRKRAVPQDNQCSYIFQGGAWTLDLECPDGCSCAIAFPLDPQEGDRVFGWCSDPIPDPDPIPTPRRRAKKKSR
jgi:hypothetical protein